MRVQAGWPTVAYLLTTCTSGRNESGPLSGPVHETVEPLMGPGGPYVHGANCDVVAANGL